MLAVGRALMAEPKILLLDEPSLGLAPRIIEEILEKLGDLNRQGLPLSSSSRKRRWSQAGPARLSALGRPIAAEIDPAP